MPPRFLYHALGVGVAGQITRPFCDVIEAQAATSLGIVGGYASSHVRDYRFRDIVSVRSARVYAVGSEGPRNTYNTSITATVEGLNILDVITADVLTARLTSKHVDNADEPSITSAGTEIRGLRIAGVPFDGELDPELTQEREYATFSKYAANRRAESNNKGNDPRNGDSAWTESKGRLFCPLVTRRDYVVRVPSVGTVFIGETFVSKYARRLTLLRVELGSPVEGRLEFASGECNGTTYP